MENENRKRTGKLLKNSFVLSFGTLIPKVLAILMLPLLTTYLSTEEYGNYDLVLSATSLIVPVVMLQVQLAVFRYLLAKNNANDRNIYISTALLFIIVLSIISAPITYMIGIVIQLPPITSFVMCGLVLAESIYLLLGQVMRGIGKNLYYSAGVIVYAIANSLLLVVFVAMVNLGLQGVVLSITISYIVSAVAMLVVTAKEYKIKFSNFEFTALKEMLSFSVPVVPSSISLWIVNLSDRFVIVHFLGTAANGIYSVANKVPALYSTAYNIFNLAWTETAVQVADTDSNPEIYYSELFKRLYNFLIGAMLCIIAISPMFYKVFINAKYYDSYYQTAILYFGVFFNSLVIYYAGIYIALKKTKQVGYSSVLGAIINVVINLLLVKKYGLYAASVSTLISYLVIAAYRCIDIQKYIKIQYEKKQIVIGMLVMILASALYFIRETWACLGCIIIAVIYNWIENKYMCDMILRKLKKTLSLRANKFL